MFCFRCGIRVWGKPLSGKGCSSLQSCRRSGVTRCEHSTTAEENFHCFREWSSGVIPVGWAQRFGLLHLGSDRVHPRWVWDENLFRISILVVRDHLECGCALSHSSQNIEILCTHPTRIVPILGAKLMFAWVNPFLFYPNKFKLLIEKPFIHFKHLATICIIELKADLVDAKVKEKRRRFKRGFSLLSRKTNEKHS